jgi:hypothetical protein
LQDLLFACLCYRQTKNEKKDAVFNILIAHGVVFQQKVDFFFFLMFVVLGESGVIRWAGCAANVRRED